MRYVWPLIAICVYFILFSGPGEIRNQGKQIKWNINDHTHVAILANFTLFQWLLVCWGTPRITRGKPWVSVYPSHFLPLFVWTMQRRTGTISAVWWYNECLQPAPIKQPAWAYSRFEGNSKCASGTGQGIMAGKDCWYHGFQRYASFPTISTWLALK